MLLKLINKIFSNRNDRVLQRMNKVVDKINQMESKLEKLSDKQLSNKTIEFRNYIKQGVNIDSLIPEAFAVVREASKRIFGMRHFDVQLLGGIVLNSRCVAEMRTGEGKTLTSTLPAYLNALNKEGVHIVTVNDYLAQRDAETNRPLFEFLGLTVGVNLQGLSSKDKRAAYAADITYGTNNEYGFDYLRDNMVFNPDERVQRKLNYALIDEVDSILIDEARTPLIISGPAEDNSDMYIRINKLIPNLICQDKEDSEIFQGKGHFSIDEKSRQVHLTERGMILIEELLVKANIIVKGESLYSPNNIILMHHINAALRAHTLFLRDVDYLIKDDKIIIVDEHTGRTMPERRWSDGLHQAIEAKENVTIQNENQPLASITFQNYFRLYKKLSGMTGTAATEAFEFQSIYKLDTIIVPTNCPMIRKDLPDLVYITEEEKINAVIENVKFCNKRKQPVLVGTISIEKSELFSNKLKQIGIPHKVLNAKFHAMEAEIISQAGRPGAVTIATNMAGRGTDIMLGGNLLSEIAALESTNETNISNITNDWQQRHNYVLSVGGLHIIGTERHESRRIDNQLRGRSGRQGDIGSSRFYLSMEDSLMRIFTSDRVSNMMRKLGMKSGESIEHPWVTKAIAKAQCKVESRNFDIRKQLLEYDNVTNDQRFIIYAQRNELLDLPDISNIIENIREDVLIFVLNKYISPQSMIDEWNIHGLKNHFKEDFDLDIPFDQWLKIEPNLNKKKLQELVLKEGSIQQKYKEITTDKNIVRNLEKSIMLQTIDLMWKEHLIAMDYLRQGIHLRGYAQKDPKQEYKRESFAMFTIMLESLKYEVISTLSKIKINNFNKQEHNNFFSKQQKLNHKITLNYNKLNNDCNFKKEKIGRNKRCSCGSGKKFKHCHGKL